MKALLVLMIGALLGSPALAGLLLSITGVKPRVDTSYTWMVANTANKASVSVAVGANMGFGQVQYTVRYTRTRNTQLTYVLSGNLVLTDEDGVGHVIELPAVWATGGSGMVYNVPSENIKCPILTVPAGGSLTCTFTAQYTSGIEPLPGTVGASVSTVGSPGIITASKVPYDFTGAELVNAGGVAKVSNYFEQGIGIMQPYGVSGEQPPPGLLLQDSRDFQFTALFGEVEPSKCGQQWKVVSTAEVTPEGLAAGSSSAQQQQAVVSLQINLIGCSTAGDSTPAFAGAPPTDGGATTPAPAPAPAPVPATTPAASPPSPATPPTAPAGVTVAEAGSTLCGGGACAPGQRCFDGWNCCPTETTVCGGVCCDSGRTCLQNQCVPVGSIPCGTQVCTPGQLCSPDNVCCPATQKVCGGSCCSAGQECVNGQCAATGSRACGTGICGPTQQCLQNICCNTGETNCGGHCCGGGNTCLQNQFCVPTGSTMCSGAVCQPPQACASGALCCDQGATFCGGSCCPVGQTCVQNKCVPPGSTVCGSNVCGSTQTCQGNIVCCDQGATFCNNACCGVGNACVSNQCVPQGSTACGSNGICPINQFCGNTLTGLCCQNINQIACGTNCCPSPQQTCNQFTLQCVDRYNTACTGGQVWCPSANMCCPLGNRCAFGECLPAGSLGRRLTSSAGIA